MQKQINELNQQLTPVIKFFNSTPPKPAVQRLSKKKKNALEIEEHLKMLEKAALAELLSEV